MIFNSLEYFVLLLVAVFLYWLAPSQTIRRFIIFVASCIFYASWNATMLLLLWSVCLLHWFCALKQRELKRSVFTTTAVTLTLVLLGVFKYSAFFARAFIELGNSFGANLDIPIWHLVLPLGISFYSFQLIAYSVDAKNGKFPVEKNPFDLFLFVMFFPHLIAGPICRPAQLIPQLKQKQTFSWDHVIYGIGVVAIGLFLKVMFADGVAHYVDQVFDKPVQFTPVQVFQAVLCYSVQIFCDFWGYSTMAIGSALMFGIRLPQNFNLPYIATGLQDFWRRWHMTLSFWLRDYLYISLGGSRHGALLTYRNLLLTMILGGLWHGANWTFIIWGAIHGIALAVERALGATLDFAGGRASLWRYCRQAAKWLYTISVVMLAWVFFRAATIHSAFEILHRIASGGRSILALETTEPAIRLMLAFIPLHLLLHRELMLSFNCKVSRLRAGSVAVLLFYLALIFSAEETKKFIYFDF